MKISIDDIKQFNLIDVFKLNPKSIVQDTMVDGMSFAIIDDVFINPELVVDFLKCFPADSYVGDIEKIYDDGITNLNDLQDKNLYLRPAGLQQKIVGEITVDLAFNLYKFLVEQDFIPPHEAMYEDNFSPWHIQQELSAFNFNTQLYFPNMLSIGGNNKPTVDRFQYMYKIFLSDGVEDGSIDFYKVNSCGRLFTSMNEIMNHATDDEKSQLSTDLNNATYGEDIKIFKPEVDESVFVKFNTIEFKYNRLILHPGSYFYNVNYNSEKETSSRFSLETGYTDYSNQPETNDE
jgi:hypothetical protein